MSCKTTTLLIIIIDELMLDNTFENSFINNNN